VLQSIALARYPHLFQWRSASGVVYLIFVATTLLTGAVALARSARDRSAYGRSSAGQEVEQ
jgi:threonine/homoserine/homoserine lactone efflux protein